MSASELELKRVRDRELELKRLRGEISCAECRRLKLRCDKKIPCNSCFRRGFQKLCPTGTSIDDNNNTKVVESATQEAESSRKLVEMSERIRALEDALQIASEASHPLLSQDLLLIKRTSVKPTSAVEKTSSITDEVEFEDAFGTLTIGEGKSMQFLGSSASENVLLMDILQNSTGSSPLTFSALPEDLSHQNEMWPFVSASLPRQSRVYQLGTYLPPLGRVTQLVAVYFSRPVWIVDPSQIQDELIPTFYPQNRPIPPVNLVAENMHDLALLFMVLCGGALIECSQSLTSPEVERYHQLALAALGLNNVFDHGSLSACQTLILLASYEVQSGRAAAPEKSWKLMCMGLIHATSIGLHRDPNHWKLDPITAERRRWVFWEMYSLDKWKCLGSGRPSLFPAHTIDCEFPRDTEIKLDDGSRVESVSQWRYRFARDVLSRLADQFCSARPSKYSAIMDLDKLVREFDTHPLVSSSINPSSPFLAENLARHPMFTVWWKERALLYVHRNYFSRAILDHGDNPMQSPFFPSFLAAFRSASTLLRMARIAVEYRHSVKRNTPFWAMSLIAAVIIGSVASRPSISFAASAYTELERAIILFQGSNHPVATYGLSILEKLRERAGTTPDKSSSQRSSRSLSSEPGVVSATHDGIRSGSEDEELHILLGTTRRIERRRMPMDMRTPAGPRGSDVMSSSSRGAGLTHNIPDKSILSALGDQHEPELTGPFVSMNRGEERMQEQNEPVEAPLPPHFHHSVGYVSDGLYAQHSSSTLDRAFEDAFAAQYMDGSLQSNVASSHPFDFLGNVSSEDPPASWYNSQQINDIDIQNLDAGRDTSGGIWRSFMQQFGPIGENELVLDNWDAMELA